ncbi:MAG: peptidoglycan-binding protein [Heteroscytonema crispum UTEX LB 1556]
MQAKFPANINENITVEMPVLQIGANGKAVRFLQRLLIAYGFFSRDLLTDEFNGRTELSVKNFQTVYRLRIDGIVGEETWQKLAEVAAEPRD